MYWFLVHNCCSKPPQAKAAEQRVFNFEPKSYPVCQVYWSSWTWKPTPAAKGGGRKRSHLTYVKWEKEEALTQIDNWIKIKYEVNLILWKMKWVMEQCSTLTWLKIEFHGFNCKTFGLPIRLNSFNVYTWKTNTHNRKTNILLLISYTYSPTKSTNAYVNLFSLITLFTG